MKKAIIFICAACIPLIFLPPAAADVLLLYQGSVLTGKIISDDGAYLLLKNYYGTYRIKRSRVDDILRTNSYGEDIAILKKRNVPFEEREVILNYRAGTGEIAQHLKSAPPSADEEKKTPAEARPADGGGRWRTGRISLSGSFLHALSGEPIPYGFGGHVAIDQGLDFIPGSGHPLIPGLRVEGGYHHYKESSYALTGFTAAGGLIWAIPSMNTRGGCFILALMPGASFLRAKSGGSFFGGSVSAGGVKLAGQAILGYQKSFGPVSLFINARYLHIFGKSSHFIRLGGEAGIGFNAW